MTILRKIQRRITRTLAHTARDVSHFAGADSAFYRSARGGRIVNYHGVCRTDPLMFNTLFVTRATFEHHLQFYREHFNTVSLDAFYRGAFDDARFTVCLTFDDGFANNHRYVLPLLEQYEIPATFFVTGIRGAGYDLLWNDFLGIVGRYGPGEIVVGDRRYRRDRRASYLARDTGRSLNDDLRAGGFAPKAAMMASLRRCFDAIDADPDYWLQMTADQIRAVSASPCATIGSHGYFHNDLRSIGTDDVVAELTLSRSWLEDVTGTPVTSLAFPYGAYDDGIVAAAKAAGYQRLLATDFNRPEDRFDHSLRERMTVNPYLSVGNQMRAIVTGHYD